MTSIAVIVPVLARPKNARPLADSFRESGADAHLVFVCSPGDDAEIDACLDATREGGCSVEFASWPSGPSDYSRKIQLGYELTDTPYVLCGADDLRFHPGWDAALLAVAEEFDVGVVGTNDLGNGAVLAGRHSTHPLVARGYINSLGGAWGEPGVVYHAGYSHNYCNTGEAPIWMADLGFQPLAEIGVGDTVMGWRRIPAGTMTLNAIEPANVLARQSRRAAVVKVTMESGRSFRCTPDHRWLNAWWSPSVANNAQWVTAEPGRLLLHVVSQTPPISTEDQWLAGWLAGIYDGEGSGIYAATQSEQRNPDVHAAICEALERLGIPHTVSKGETVDHFWLSGGLQGFVDFIGKVQPVKRAKLLQRVVGGRRFGTRDRVIDVTPDGEDEVISLTTSTGNYVAWGYASRNCDVELVELAKLRGCYAHAHDSIVEHTHHLWRKGVMDDTYRLGQRDVKADRVLFEARQREWMKEAA